VFLCSNNFEILELRKGQGDCITANYDEQERT